MKPIEDVDLKKCYEWAKAEVQVDLEAQVIKQIKAQLMALAQLKIKVNNAVTEEQKLIQQLDHKALIIAKIAAGDWTAVPDSAKERDDIAGKELPFDPAFVGSGRIAAKT